MAFPSAKVLFRGMACLDYDILSGCYDELYGEEQRGKYGWVVRAAGPRLGVLLDAGCGTALLLDYLRSGGVGYVFYVGVDISLGMLRKAKTRKDPSSDLVQADIHRLPFREKSYDTTVSVTVMHHLEHSRALSELRRVTRSLLIVTRHRSLDGRRVEGEEIELPKESIYIIKP